MSNPYYNPVPPPNPTSQLKKIILTIIVLYGLYLLFGFLKKRDMLPSIFKIPTIETQDTGLKQKSI